jgi:hypothetical protein
MAMVYVIKVHCHLEMIIASKLQPNHYNHIVKTSSTYMGVDFISKS